MGTTGSDGLDIRRVVHGLLTAQTGADTNGPRRVAIHQPELERLIEDLLDRGPCAFTVRGMRILVNGEPWGGGADVATGFAFKMRRRGMRTLTLRPGINRGEVQELVALFAMQEAQLTGGGALREFHLHLTLQTGRHVEVTPLAKQSCLQLPGHVSDVIEECLCDAQMIETLGKLRRDFTQTLGLSGGDSFDALAGDFFRRPQWSDVPAHRIREAFDRFLSRVKRAMFGGDPHDAARVARIQALFHTVAPSDLIDTPRVAVVSRDEATCEEQPHDPNENALLIMCQLMGNAGGRTEYYGRRETLLASFRDRSYSSRSIARVLRYIAIDMPAPTYEHRDNLVSDVLDRTADGEALVEFLASMTRQPDVARPILNRLIVRPNPFPVLVRLIRAPELKSFRNMLIDKLVEAGRLKKDALARWAREDRDSFFATEVFDSFFALAPELLGPPCKDILTEGPEADRTRLIDTLRDAGNEVALRLLVLGMPYGEEGCDAVLLDALGSFRHPLAVVALREVIHRNNLRRPNEEEARVAMQALHRLGASEGWDFLWEIVQRRSFLLPFYRRQLRQIATLVLEGAGEVQVA